MTLGHRICPALAGPANPAPLRQTEATAAVGEVTDTIQPAVFLTPEEAGALRDDLAELLARHAHLDRLTDPSQRPEYSYPFEVVAFTTGAQLGLIVGHPRHRPRRMPWLRCFVPVCPAHFRAVFVIVGHPRRI